MKNMRRMTWLMVVVVSLSLLGSCSKKPETKGRIGVTCMDLTNPFFKLITDIMTEELAKHGYEVVSRDASNNPTKQNNHITDFVAQDFDAIFLNPADSHIAGEGVKKAHEAGIPVFTFDVQISHPEAKELVVSHIGSDNFQGGRLAGESMMKATGDEGEIAIISHPEVTSCILRVDGFKEYLKKHDSKLEIVTELAGKAARDESFTVATDILQAHENIVGIFAINDPSGLGAYAAVQNAGLTDQITIVAFDASPAGKKAIFDKKIYDTPQQFPRKMAQGTVEAFLNYLEGKAVEEKNNFIPCSHYYYEDSLDDESRIKERW
jgi:ribose transport system substrate-binding protein